MWLPLGLSLCLDVFEEDFCCPGPPDLPQPQPHPITRPEPLEGTRGAPGRGLTQQHSLRPADLGVGDGTDEGHHAATVQEQPHQWDGCLLLFSADLTQDMGCRR